MSADFSGIPKKKKKKKNPGFPFKVIYHMHNSIFNISYNKIAQNKVYQQP